MSYQQHIHVTRELFSRSQATLKTDQGEIFFTSEEMSMKISPSCAIEEIFQNVAAIPLKGDLYLKKEGDSIFLSQKTPSLHRYTFFRRYVTEYVREMNDWKQLFE